MALDIGGVMLGLGLWGIFVNLWKTRQGHRVL